MAGNAHPTDIVEALRLASERFDKNKKPAQPFDFGQTIRDADKSIQSGVFGITDAIGHEGKRLIDGKFGFDALSSSLPKLAQSGPQNLAEAIATTRQGGAQWTNQDLQAQRDRDNLGKAGGGAMDATWLLPAVPAAKAGVKGVGEVLRGFGGTRTTPKLEEVLAKAADQIGPQTAADARGGLTAFKSPDGIEYRVNIQETPDGPFNVDFSRAHVDAELSKHPFAPQGGTGYGDAMQTYRNVLQAVQSDAAQFGRPAYTWRGMTSQQQRLYDKAFDRIAPPEGYSARRDGRNFIWEKPNNGLQSGVGEAKQSEMRASDIATRALRLENGDKSRTIKYLRNQVAELEELGDSAESLAHLAAADLLESGRFQGGGVSPTTLNMGFGFGGKDGEKPLLSALKGKSKDAPLLPNASAPTSLDDIFTGAPKAPRPDSGPFSPQQQAYIAQNQLPDNFDLSAPTAFERMENASAAMQAPASGLRVTPSPKDGPFMRDFDYPLPGGQSGKIKANVIDDHADIVHSEIPEGLRGQGNGSAMYRAMLDWAKQNGLRRVNSDIALTPGGEGLYKSLARQGVDVQRNPGAFFGNGMLRHQVDPVYTVNLQSAQKPLGYDDWGPEWRAAFDRGLPMDTASRMARAREQGFDVGEQLYHGTTGDFGAFKQPMPGFGIFGSTSPAEASEYSQLAKELGRGDSPSVMPIFARNARGDTGTQRFVKNSSDIRSTSAAFDPANAGRPNLLGMSTFDSPGLPPSSAALPKAPASLEELIAQSIKRPDDIPEGDWVNIMGGVQQQNAELARIMSEGKLMSGAEWGGVARPGGPSALQTKGDPFGVSVNTTDADKLTGIINHSHPHVIPGSNGTQYPGSLSLMDLFATKEARGITSLEPEGGFGFAIANPKAPALENAEWTKILEDSLQASAPHLPGNVFPYSVGGSHVPVYEAEMIAQKALGTAMKRTNMLEQYGYATKNPAQGETIRQSEAAINAGADAAEKSLREVLKARGFTDGQIAALIAQFGSLGAAMGALGMGGQQKAPALSSQGF